MYALIELPAGYDALAQRSKELVRALCGQIPPLRTDVTISSNTEIYSDLTRKGKIYRLKEGTVQYLQDDRVTLLLEEGDLIGMHTLAPSLLAKVQTEFAVIVDEYDANDFITQCSAPALLPLWAEYQGMQMTLLTALLSSLLEDAGDFQPDMLSFDAGEVIIQEGTDGTDVFTMVEGIAEVSINGRVIGTVEPDEIFGAIAPMLNTARTTTVTAVSPCLVLSLPKDKFDKLLKTRPSTANKLFQDMAKTVMALNEKIGCGTSL